MDAKTSREILLLCQEYNVSPDDPIFQFFDVYGNLLYQFQKQFDNLKEANRLIKEREEKIELVSKTANEDITQNAGSVAARISTLAQEETHRLHQVAMQEETFLKESFQKKLEELFKQINSYQESLEQARNRLDFEHKGLAKQFVGHVNSQKKHSIISFTTLSIFSIIQTIMLAVIILKVL